MGQHTLCANLCCCILVAVTAEGRILDKAPENVEVGGRMEARVLDARARCILKYGNGKLDIHADVEIHRRYTARSTV